MNIQASYALLDKILILKKSALFSMVTTSELRSLISHCPSLPRQASRVNTAMVSVLTVDMYIPARAPIRMTAPTGRASK